MGDLGFEPRTSGLRVRCAAVAPVTLALSLCFNLVSTLSDLIAAENGFSQGSCLCEAVFKSGGGLYQ